MTMETWRVVLLFSRVGEFLVLVGLSILGLLEP